MMKQIVKKIIVRTPIEPIVKKTYRAAISKTLNNSRKTHTSIPANVFLLTHKCGNNYIIDAYRKADKSLIQFQADELRGQMRGPYVGDMKKIPNCNFANIRCRNFAPLSVEKLIPNINVKRSEFFLFVRHPASLFRSAATYHLRGDELWANTIRYKYLNGKTLHEALRDAKDLEQRLLISMNHFGKLWQLTNNWLNCYHYLSELGANLTVVKTEDLFVSGDDTFFDHLAEKMSHHGFTITPAQLKECSPKYLKELPSHSTGEFKKDPLSGYSGKALEMYNKHFFECEKFFYS